MSCYEWRCENDVEEPLPSLPIDFEGRCESFGSVWRGHVFRICLVAFPRLHCTGHKAHKQSYAYRYDHCTLTV